MRLPFLALAACLGTGLAPAPASAQDRGALAAVLRRGDDAWTANRHDAAYAAYDSVVRGDSSLASHAVYRLGVLKSWQNELPDAIRLHQLYVRLEPRDLEGRVGLARVYSWASRFATSVATYDTVLAREADYRDAAFGRATALAWWGKLGESIAAYDAWIATHPTDTEAQLGRARVLSWAGRLDEALAVYERIARDGNTAEAEKGIARVTAWQGEFEKSERLWQATTTKYATDPETWVGLGQVLRWMGRPFAARDALEQALRVRPSYEDAHTQLRWVRAEIGRSVSPTYTYSTDSEHNDGHVLGLRADGAVGTRARLGLRALRRDNSSTSGSGSSTSLRAAGDWQPGDGAIGLRAELGFTSVSSDEGPSLPTPGSPALTTSKGFTVGSLRLRTTLGQRVRVGAGISRDAFDDIVQTMREGLAMTVVDADAGLSLPGRTSLSAFASTSAAEAEGIEANTRTTGGVSARWAPRRELALLANVRSTAWDRPAYGTYFAPQRFTLAEVAARWERPADLGWQAAAEFGFGRQSIRFESDDPSSRAVPRGSVMFGWRPEPGREVMVTWLFANVASASTLSASEYSYRSLMISARLTR